MAIVDYNKKKLAAEEAAIREAAKLREEKEHEI